MSVMWVLQNNLLQEKLEPWKDAVLRRGSKLAEISIIPFADELPDVPAHEGPIVCYGSTTMIKNAKAKGWNPGIFFDVENFRCSKWNEMYGQNMFNSDGYVSALKDLKDLPDLFFMRPDNDLKDFSGSVVSPEGLQKFVDSVSAGGFLFDGNLQVFVEPTKPIHKEWRCFIVNGKVASCSQYRFRSALLLDHRVPKEVKEFAERMAAIWSPERAFVMDVCETMERELKILELNCFNASGVYHCDVDAIVEAVEALFRTEDTAGKTEESSS